MKKVLFFVAMIVCATTFTSCSEDFWSGFEAGYNAWSAPARVDTPTDVPSESDTTCEEI